MSGLVRDRGEWFLEYITAQVETLVTRQKSYPGHEDCFGPRAQEIYNHLILWNLFDLLK